MKKILIWLMLVIMLYAGNVMAMNMWVSTDYWLSQGVTVNRGTTVDTGYFVQFGTKDATNYYLDFKDSYGTGINFVKSIPKSLIRINNTYPYSYINYLGESNGYIKVPIKIQTSSRTKAGNYTYSICALYETGNRRTGMNILGEICTKELNIQVI